MEGRGFRPTFLTRTEVLAIHGDQVRRYGGSAGLRDAGLLRSALAMPEAGTRDGYFHEDIPAMAAAYLYHLVKNHPFVDGNKRVGAMAAFVFLRMNGFILDATNEELETIVMEVAGSAATKDGVIEFFREHALPEGAEGAGGAGSPDPV